MVAAHGYGGEGGFGSGWVLWVRDTSVNNVSMFLGSLVFLLLLTIFAYMVSIFGVWLGLHSKGR